MVIIHVCIVVLPKNRLKRRLPHLEPRDAMKLRLISTLICVMARFVAASLRLRVIGEERVRAFQEAGRGVILVTWHGRTLVPITRFRGLGYWAVISTSRDGEYQNRIFQRLGWQTVRGSTSARGAVRSAIAMCRHLRDGATLAFTPDGPRGPCGQVQPGAIFLAQKSGCPIIPAGISAHPRALARTWDRYLVPGLFARAALIYGEPIFIPKDADAEELRVWAERVGAAINALENEAEQLVGASSKGSAQDRTQWRRA
jgi:lysophospholipid acyltransferase (LPLAT)-like uncharacterized protein